MSFENLLPINNELGKEGMMIYNHKYLLRTNIIQTLLGTKVSKTGIVLVLMALDRMVVEARK